MTDIRSIIERQIISFTMIACKVGQFAKLFHPGVKLISDRCLTITWEQSPHQICSPISPGSLCHADRQSLDLATVFSGHAKEESNCKRLQRFLREFETPYAE